MAWPSAGVGTLTVWHPGRPAGPTTATLPVDLSLAGVAPAGSCDFANPAGNLVVDLVGDDAVWRPIRTR
jgi:hypothetical protein